MNDELDLMTAILGDGSNICLSGGADGADLQWGMCAGLLGHKVIHWSFAGHHTNAPEVEVVRLSSEQLERADEAIAKAAKSLKKGEPNKAWVKPLIQRNWYQVQWSDSVYAVCPIVEGVPQGGTAWAIQMYLDRDVEHHCYVFEQTIDSWCRWSDSINDWVIVGKAPPGWTGPPMPPSPTGIWAGIGTRNLKDNGKRAIRDLMGYVKPAL